MIFYMKKIKEKHKKSKYQLIDEVYEYLYWKEYVCEEFFLCEHTVVATEYSYYYNKDGVKLCRTNDRNKVRQDLIDEIFKS